ncbi:hypothetical protein [Aestuariispira ectoiniformans]|uniref:hypothetical protein n=1 Tax=Aestuariispira ectoiniformans TaxID=2775080 RepID=UPI00223AA999|nr:hypothetical protein [Aestuariispira ectoiniformans]
MSDLGIVVYRPGREPGTLEADWYSDELDRKVVCKGVAKGGIPGRIEGDYKVFYCGPDDEDDDCFDLSIEKEGEIFVGRWFEKGKFIYHGFGIVIDGGIAMAWQKVK